MRVIFKVCCKPNATLHSASSNSIQRDPLSPLEQQSRASRRPNLATRQPPLVVTLKPSLVDQRAPSPKPQGASFEAHNWPSTFGGSSSQPITVLPIEVLQPSSTESASSSMPSSEQPSSATSLKDDERNDIPQHDQVPIQQSQPPSPPIPQLRYPSAGTRAHTPPPMLTFDPKAPPDYLKQANNGRWAPTPLPSSLLNTPPSNPSISRFPSSHQTFGYPPNRPAQLESAGQQHWRTRSASVYSQAGGLSDQASGASSQQQADRPQSRLQFLQAGWPNCKYRDCAANRLIKFGSS